MHTELGRSQVEVPVHTELGSWQRAWRRVGKAEVEVEVDADMAEEKLEGEEAAEAEENGENLTILTWQVGKNVVSDDGMMELFDLWRFI